MSSSVPSLGERLRLERERRKITLASISENTKIPTALLEGLERDDVSRWPSGIFRRSFIRSYAAAVGMDGEATVREFLERFPDPAEAEPAAEVAALAKATLEERARERSGLERWRVRICDAGVAFMRGPLLSELRRRWAAAAWDTAVVVLIGVLLFVAMQEFWMPLAVVTVGYYVGSIVLLGNTPGVSLFAPDPRRHDR